MTESTHVVFIDGDWLSVGTRQGRIPLTYPRLMAFFKRRFGDDVAVHMYLSTTPKGQGTARLAGTLAELGIALHVVSMDGRGKSNIDMQLAMDAMALPARTTSFALVSGDSGFVPLLRQMRQSGRRTILISFPLMLSTLLRDAADDFINLETVVAANAAAGPQRDTGPTARQASHRPPSQVLVDKGEHLKPYLLIRKLLVAARNEVGIIDPYIGVELFELLACLGKQVGVTMITDQRHLPPDLGALVARCRKEGRRLRVYSSRDIHDRYLRIDDDWWHSGHSFKDLGSRVSHVTHVNAHMRTAMQQIERRALEGGIELCPAAPS